MIEAEAPIHILLLKKNPAPGLKLKKEFPEVETIIEAFPPRSIVFLSICAIPIVEMFVIKKARISIFFISDVWAKQ